MAVLELVSVPTFSQQRSNFVQPSNLEVEAGRVAKKHNMLIDMHSES